jgi:protein CMS1
MLPSLIIGVGTPKRLTDLIEDGALSTASLRRVVLDASYIDEKRRWLFSIKEVGAEVMKLLRLPALAERYGQDHGIELIMY